MYEGNIRGSGSATGPLGAGYVCMGTTDTLGDDYRAGYQAGRAARLVPWLVSVCPAGADRVAWLLGWLDGYGEEKAKDPQ